MRPASAPLWLGLGSGLVVAAMFVHLFVPGRDSAATAETPAATAEPSAPMFDPADRDEPDPDAMDTEPSDPDPSGPAAEPVADEPSPSDGELAQTEPSATDLPDGDHDGIDVPALPDIPAVPDIIEVTVPDGLTAREVAQLLAEAGVIPDDAEFRRLIYERQASTRLRSGTFMFAPGRSVEAILDDLIRPLP